MKKSKNIKDKPTGELHMLENKGKVIIFSAPSGSGKSTIVNYLLKQNLGLEFSISATTRLPRG